MPGLDNSVNKVLSQMRKQSQTGKGSYGEMAVFKICEQYYQRDGGILIQDRKSVV